MTHNELHQAAERARSRGMGWQWFVSMYDSEMRDAEPYNAQAYRKLRQELHHVLIGGDPDELPRQSVDRPVQRKLFGSKPVETACIDHLARSETR